MSTSLNTGTPVALPQSSAGRECAAAASMSTHGCLSCCLESLVALVSSTSSLTIFPLLFRSPLSSGRKELMEILHLGLRVPRSLTLSTVWLRVSASVPICRGGVSDDDCERPSMGLAECQYESLNCLASILAKMYTLCYVLCTRQ